MKNKIMKFIIVCLCGMELEVADHDTVECPDCHREYDDRGVRI